MKKGWKIFLIISLLGNLTILYVGMKALEYRAHINEFLDKYTYVVNEFSRRDRYAGENKSLISDELVENRVVFLGSQVTENWNLTENFPEYETVNRGVSYQRVSGFLLRFRPDVIELHPGAVLIEISSYNFRPESSVKEIEDYAACMADLAKANGIEPYLTTIIPPCQDSADLGEYSIMDSLAAFNSWVKEYCGRNNLEFVDFNRAVAGSAGFLSPQFTSGAIDLNREGYRVISLAAREILGKINRIAPTHQN